MIQEAERTPAELLLEALRRGRGSVSISTNKMTFAKGRRRSIVIEEREPEELEPSFCEGFRPNYGVRAVANIITTEEKPGMVGESKMPYPLIKEKASFIKIHNLELQRHKLIIRIDVPIGVLDNTVPNLFAIGAGPHLGMLMAKKAEEYFTNGSGEDEPRGIAYGTDNLPTMRYEEALAELGSPSQQQCGWVIHSRTFWDLVKEGGHDIITGTNLKMRGYPVSLTKQLDKEKVLFGNFKEGYVIWEEDKVELTVKPAAPDKEGFVLLEVSYYAGGDVRDRDAFLAFKPAS